MGIPKLTFQIFTSKIEQNFQITALAKLLFHSLINNLSRCSCWIIKQGLSQHLLNQVKMIRQCRHIPIFHHRPCIKPSKTTRKNKNTEQKKSNLYFSSQKYSKQLQNVQIVQKKIYPILVDDVDDNNEPSIILSIVD